jgi:hypothetical protein
MRIATTATTVATTIMILSTRRIVASINTRRIAVKRELKIAVQDSVRNNGECRRGTGITFEKNFFDVVLNIGLLNSGFMVLRRRIRWYAEYLACQGRFDEANR